MKKITWPEWILIGLISILLIEAVWAAMPAKAQTVVPPLTFQSTVPHTSCPAVAANITQYCFASDGEFESIAGAAYVQVQAGAPAGGVTSLSVNGGTPQTGAVSITVPTKVTLTATAPTVTGTIQ